MDLQQCVALSKSIDEVVSSLLSILASDEPNKNTIAMTIRDLNKINRDFVLTIAMKDLGRE